MAEVTVRAGRKSEVMSPERRQRLAELVEVLRSDGHDVEVEITEYEPGRRDVAFPEFVYVYVAGPAAGALAVKVANDIYEKARAWARKQWAAKHPPEPTETTNGRPEVVLLYGPDGEASDVAWLDRPTNGVTWCAAGFSAEFSSSSSGCFC